jgi:hypothetical protein
MTTASSSACHGPASGSSGASNKLTWISSLAVGRRIHMWPLLADSVQLYPPAPAWKVGGAEIRLPGATFPLAFGAECASVTATSRETFWRMAQAWPGLGQLALVRWSPTALAARIVGVQIGSSWTNVLERSRLNAVV